MDEKTYKINIDPRILELLGPSLYTNIYYILAELIANAYDANAHNVYITQETDLLTVEDDGHGMSYENGDIEKYLNVAQETRVNANDSYVDGSNTQRKKMGRKGIGKLAALSVSDEVEIKTIRNNEKSGFILSRRVSDDHLLTAIPDEEVNFKNINEQGTAIVMRSPQYQLHRTIKAIRNNILKIFPLIDVNFKIHLETGGRKSTIESFETEMIQGLGGIIILGDKYKYLLESFNCQLRTEGAKDELAKVRPSYKEEILLKKKNGENALFELTISGWIGAYKSTKGKKTDQTDFPDNFISLLSNGKLGEFNILPQVGKNKLNEVFIVGQLHVDLFEESSLPDMALSNRQGYKSDDERHKIVIKYVRDKLLPDAVALRVKYSTFSNNEKNINRDIKNKHREETLKFEINNFKKKASKYAARKISNLSDFNDKDSDEITSLVERAININLPEMGIKSVIDKAKKRLLISHSQDDKTVCDFVFNLLIFNGIPPEEIIYSSGDNPLTTIPQKTHIFDYLRDFFVESYSTEKIYVLYVTSNSMGESWPAVSEVGAGWITKSNHDIFNINGFSPKKPLDVDSVWANIATDDNGIVFISTAEANRVAEKIRYATNQLGYESKTDDLLLAEIWQLAEVSD